MSHDYQMPERSDLLEPKLNVVQCQQTFELESSYASKLNFFDTQDMTLVNL